MKTPTLQTIADEARLSRTTVSLILNGKGDQVGIKAETQQMVRDIAARMNYRVNHLARGLAGKATRTVGIIWSFSGYHPHQMIRRELMVLFEKHGYRSYVADTLSEWGKLEYELDDFLRRGVDGVIVNLPPEMMVEWVKLRSSPVATMFNAINARLVVMHNSQEAMELPCPVIYRDEHQAISQLMTHLAVSGRKRIAILTHLPSNQPKVNTAISTLKTKFGFDPASVTIYPLQTFSKYHPWDPVGQSMQQLAEMKIDWRKHDAVFCTADEVALALMAQLRKDGVRCPDEVAVVGYNNSPCCQAMDPALASVEWNNAKVIDAIEKMFIPQLQGQASCEATSARVPLDFVWRESAGGSGRIMS